LKLCVCCHIKGHVQGVFFRASTREQARALNITGYAKNLSDGRVEVLAYGERDDIENLKDWLKQGPSSARVEELICADKEVVIAATDFLIG